MTEPTIDVSVAVSPDLDTSIDLHLLRDAAISGLLTVRESDHQPPVEIRSASLEVSILVTDDAEIHRLNREYRQVDRPTDILSFSLVTDDAGLAQVLPVDGLLTLGDIVLSYPYAVRQARELGHSVEMELSWLAIHGALQLVGYTHDTDAAAERMEALERVALERLGFSPP